MWPCLLIQAPPVRLLLSPSPFVTLDLPHERNAPLPCFQRSCHSARAPTTPVAALCLPVSNRPYLTLHSPFFPPCAPPFSSFAASSLAALQKLAIRSAFSPISIPPLGCLFSFFLFRTWSARYLDYCRPKLSLPFFPAGVGRARGRRVGGMSVGPRAICHACVPALRLFRNIDG